VCKQYESQIDSLKNFSRAWIEGSTNHKTSNIVDHATSEQHKAAMARLTEGHEARNYPLLLMPPSPAAFSLL